MKYILFLIAMLSFRLAIIAQIKLTTALFQPFDVTIKEETYRDKMCLVMEQITHTNSQKTFALINSTKFHNGTIELLVAGDIGPKAVEGAKGFVGVVFRAQDTAQFELIYIRPANGRAPDQVRRNHSTQYVSYPGYPWERLRKEFPEKYESYTDLQLGEWTHLKIAVKDNKAELFINKAGQPALIVNDLKHGKDLIGKIGLWIGPGTIARFSDLKVTNID